jgi:formylglycine-generating enzyme required for sulfatase activity
MFRNSLAKYVIANSDEWHKGAYGNPNGSWSNFPNGSDIAPTAVDGGTDPNTAVYRGQGQSNTRSGPADITNAGGLSSYGTMGQGGNVWEWNETSSDGSNDLVGEDVQLRSGCWIDVSYHFEASSRLNINPTNGDGTIGFRVASVPEPSSLSLLVLGGVVVALRRRR